MTPCNLCPRRCNVDRSVTAGWCGMDNRIHVASIVLHRGEEPPLSGQKGIVNLFFPSCNMHCIYCQNWEISCRGTQGTVMSLEEVCDAIIALLPYSENNLGFVSPTHFVLQMVAIVKELHQRGHWPTIVYNTNGYDLPETIRSLEGVVDVWLPDFKYSDDRLAGALSLVPHYSKYALASLKEMVRQTGTTLQTDGDGIARRGIIIRHLVLPGFPENSIGVLKMIAEELSPNLHISLMSQYYPPDNPEFRAFVIRPAPGRNIGTPDSADGSEILVKREPDEMQDYSDAGPLRERDNDQLHDYITGYKSDFTTLKQSLSRRDYEAVVSSFHSLGFTRGWLQDYSSYRNYQPDFSKDQPFE